MVNIVVPYTEIKVYRPEIDPKKLLSGESSLLNDKRNRKNIEPSEITLREIYTINNQELKGLEHEETALFGHVAEVNIGSQPSSSLFRKVLPNDHIEIYYENMGFHDMDVENFTQDTFFQQRHAFKKQEDLLLQNDFSSNLLAPKFQGSVWKADLIQKPSQLTTKVGAWGYLRMLQYVNVPKSFEGRENETITTLLQQEGGLRNERSGRITFRNDFLDYVDNLFMEYLKNLGIPSLYTTPDFSTSGDEKIKIKYDHAAEQLRGNFYALGGTENVARKMKNTFQLYLDNLSPEGDITVESILDIDDLIDTILPQKPTGRGFGRKTVEERRSELKSNTYNVVRFLDVTAGLEMEGMETKDGEDNIEQETLEYFRVVGDVVVMDQLFLAKLLTAGITIDHGINTWYTPVLKFDEKFVSRMKEINQGSLSHLAYIRLKIGRSAKSTGIDETDRGELKEDEMETFITFNLDTFNLFQYLEEIVKSSLFQQKLIYKMFYDTTLQKRRKTDAFTPVELFGLIFTNVIEGLPQKRFPTVPVPINIKKNVERVISKNKDSDGNRYSENYYTELRKRRANLSTNILGMRKFLALDDKLIHYIKNIPASYVRQDVYQGSQFKVATTDSLPLPRLIQIIATTMKGYPATNNPETSETKGNINNYSIFLANRVLLSPKMFYSFEVETDNDSTTYICENNLRGKVTEEARDVTMFLQLYVSYKTQVSKEEEIEYEIDVGDVNDLEIIKGSTQNHFYNFSLDKHTIDKIQSINVDQSSEIELEQIIAPRLFMWFGSDEQVGISPSEFQTLTIKDMTQDLHYDAIYHREVINGHIQDGTDEDTLVPIYDVGAQANEIIEKSTDNNLKNYSKRKQSLMSSYVKVALNEKADGEIFNLWDGQDLTSDQFLMSNFDDPEYVLNGNLLSVQTYVDISDILDEIKYLRRLNSDPNLQYRHIANADEPLFNQIRVSLPFVLTVTGSTYRRVEVKNGTMEGSLSEIIEELGSQFFGAGSRQFTDDHMAWSFPVKGQVARREDSTFVIENIDLLEQQDNANGLLKSNLIAVYILDLFIKGIRYLLWSIAKSRFTAHIYTPIEHVKQGTDYQRKKDGGTQFGQNKSPIQAGSSIRFIMDESNTFLLGDKGKGSKGDSYDSDAFEHLKPKEGSNTLFEPHPLIHVKSLENNFLKESKRNLEEVFSDVGESLDDFGFELARDFADNTAENTIKGQSLIWYVSKKIIYIGESGMMMRLLMTEGSFDWTIFYREDTVATRISENYLLSGMGNFFLRGRGQ